MKLLSLFDGSGGFPLAGHLSGITPIYASEVEPYPIAVTTSRFPNMRHLGDISKVNGAELEPVDVITFGSPCQDLSVAGKRAGLKHEDHGDDETTRSGLFMEAVRIIKEMRRATDGKRPAYAVWENVPGAFSSNRGEDFRTVLQELIRIVEPEAPTLPAPDKNGWPYADLIVGDGWSIAYRTLDAQYWGVPQRRKRIYLVLHLTGERAGEVLFERKGVRGYFEEGRSPWKNLTPCIENCADKDNPKAYGVSCHGDGNSRLAEETHYCLTTGGGQPGQGFPCVLQQTYVIDQIAGQGEYAKESEINPTLRAGGLGAICYDARGNGDGFTGAVDFALPIENHPADSRVSIDESGKVQTLTSRMGTGGGNVPMVMQPMAYSFDSLASNSMKSSNPHSGCRRLDVAKTLDCADPSPAKNQGGIAVLQPVFCLQGNGIDRADTAGCNGKGWTEGVCYTLNTIDRPAVSYAMQGYGEYKQSDVGSCLRCSGYKMAYDLVEQKDYIVRRLTPTECARLQGFPDFWGDITPKEDFTDEEYHFWLDVRNTHARINGREEKVYSKAQLLQWYNKLHSDSSEYKMWGNGIALPNALYVMQGIADALSDK